ncbi:MAG: hypothetical protein QXN97_05095 [Desulfurococcaceae archaeon]|jgi:hypothetical protein
MAYTWEPKWEVFEVNLDGIKFKTCRDKITGLIACPICIHAASRCLGEPEPRNYVYENSFFYSAEDLINHIKNYHIGELRKKLEKLLTKTSEEEA